MENKRIYSCRETFLQTSVDMLYTHAHMEKAELSLTCKVKFHTNGLGSYSFMWCYRIAVRLLRIIFEGTNLLTSTTSSRCEEFSGIATERILCMRVSPFNVLALVSFHLCQKIVPRMKRKLFLLSQLPHEHLMVSQVPAVFS